jgi:hypothetical protein
MNRHTLYKCASRSIDNIRKNPILPPPYSLSLDIRLVRMIKSRVEARHMQKYLQALAGSKWDIPPSAVDL